MSKLNLVKDILAIVASALLVVFTLVLFACSCGYYHESWGQEFYCNEEYLMYLIISILILAYVLVKSFAKNPSAKEFAYYGCLGTAVLYFGCFNLTGFFKPLMKAINKTVVEDAKFSFNFEAYQKFLYFGIVALVVVAYLVVKYFADKKKAN